MDRFSYKGGIIWVGRFNPPAWIIPPNFFSLNTQMVPKMGLNTNTSSNTVCKMLHFTLLTWTAFVYLERRNWGV